MARKFSEVLDEYLAATSEGEPENQWRSIGENAKARKHYYDHLTALRREMDEMVSAVGKSEVTGEKK